MYVEFASLVLIDFKAFKGRHALALNGEGVVHVVGENLRTKSLAANGAAKSTLVCDAISWCLYGKTPLGLTNNDIKPWSGGKPSVTVLIVVDEREYLCRRTTSPKNLFTVNDEERADISEVLPISFELFINTILLPQGKELFFDRSPKDKMGIIADAVGLERWDLRASAASKAADSFETKVNRLLDEQSNFEGRLEELDETLTATRAQSTEWHGRSQARVQTSKAALKGLEKDYERKSNELGSAVLVEDGALLELRASEQLLRDKEREAARVIADLRVVRSEIDRVGAQEAGAQDDLGELLHAKTCPTCGQPVKANNLAQHKLELEAKAALYRGQRLAKIKERDKIRKDGATFEKALERITQEVTRFRERANDAGDVITRLRPEVEALKRQIEDAHAVREETNPYLNQIKELSERRKGLTTDLAAIKSDVEAAQAEMERARFWVKGFKEIKLQLIEEVLQELELVANSMIEEVGLEDWEIRCDIEKENKSGSVQRLINIQVNSPDSQGFVKWHSWSGGEKQRLKLIGSLALGDVLLNHMGIETNLEVLDEPAVYWSSEGVQELCGFLAERARERKKTIFFVEHQVVESTHLSEVITVVKEKTGAYIR